MTTSTIDDPRDIAAAQDLANRLAVLGSRSEYVLARLVIHAKGDQVTIELPAPGDAIQAPESRRDRRFARALRRAIFD